MTAAERRSRPRTLGVRFSAFFKGRLNSRHVRYRSRDWFFLPSQEKHTHEQY
jgi:hypothetical protein